MKGGGLTWLGWLMVGTGGMLVYAGMTGQSLVGELSAVLNGKSPAKGFGGGGEFGKAVTPTNDSANAVEHSARSRAVPMPIYGATTGSRGEGGGI